MAYPGKYPRVQGFAAHQEILGPLMQMSVADFVCMLSVDVGPAASARSVSSAMGALGKVDPAKPHVGGEIACTGQELLAAFIGALGMELRAKNAGRAP